MTSKNITIAENLVVKSAGSVLVVIAPDKFKRVRGYSIEEIEDHYVTLLAEMSEYLDSLNEDDIEPWMWQKYNWNKATEEKQNELIPDTILIRGKNGDLKPKSFTRATLHQLCIDAIVHERSWNDRDASAAHLNIGKCWALLSAGCEYSLEFENDYINVQFKVRDFAWFEYQDDNEEPASDNHKYKFYLPTRERLNEANGEDWY